MATNPGNSGGTQITNGATSGSTGLASVTFAARYQYLEVKNLDVTAGNSIWVTTNGVAATPGGANDNFQAGPGERILVPNQGLPWWQGFGCIDGTKVNPGTTVSIAAKGATTASPFEVAGIG